MVCGPYKACCWLWNVIAKFAGYILIVCIHTPVDDIVDRLFQVEKTEDLVVPSVAEPTRQLSQVEKMLFNTLQDRLCVS